MEDNSFMRIIRKSEYDKIDTDAAVLQESATAKANDSIARLTAISPITHYTNNKFNKFKNVLTECFCNVYMNSLIIDEPEKYEVSLRESASVEFNDLIKDCKSSKDVFVLFENASTYIQEAMLLAEAASDDVTDQKALTPDDLILPEDKANIESFEKIQGKEDVGKEIQDRVVDVYKAEEENAQKRKDAAQNLIADVSTNSDDGLNESAIVSGLNSFASTPSTIFQAMYINRCKCVINENASNLQKSQDEILGETVCMYTLLECINGLGLKVLTFKEKEDLKVKLHLG